MSIEVIAGPPGSGRGAAVVARFREALDLDPVLVAPTSDDVDRLERELCATPGGVLGGTITSFPGLFGEVARAVGVASASPLTPVQITWLARQAASGTELHRLARSSARDGFAPALAGLIGELQSAGLDAAAFATAVADADAGPYEHELSALFASYERLRDATGGIDEHQLAARATSGLRARPEAWSHRPVLLYGFDDLTREQIELVDALGAAAALTATVTFEDRSALAARAELLAVLRDELGASVTEAGPGGEGADPVLRHLERNLFEAGSERVPAGDSVRILEGAGEHGEAEMIGRKIARLLADGTDPDEIAVVVRTPDRQALPLARSLSRMGIPVAAEAAVPLPATATGAALDELLAIVAGEGSSATVVSFLRRPGRARPATVDWLEREIRRGRIATAEEALAVWAGDREEGPRRIWSLEDLRAAGKDPAAIAAVLGRTAADIAEREHKRSGLVPSGADALELRAASEAGRALAEATALGSNGPRDLDAFRELLGHVGVPLWRGPTEGRVRILSPYRLRATKVSHLFAAGLADGSFPAAGGSDPLLGEERRRLLGLPARSDPVAEERYLFYTCVAKPERCLHLSYPASDEAGGEAPRSPFVEDVLDLLDGADEPGAPGVIERSTLADFVPAPEEASTTHDLARAIAAAGGDAAGRLRSLDVPGEAASAALALVEAAERRVEAAGEPGPLRSEAVLAELGGRDLFGASTLEEFLGCSYRWFVNHELRPRRIDPDPDALESGGIVHEALERLFRGRPGGERRPCEESCDRWVASARELIREIAAERGWDLESASACISLARLDAVVERLLRRDAAFGGPLLPDPDLLEVRFGDRPDDRFGPADFGGFRLHGAIDRIDVGEGRALIRDYKLSAKAIAGAKLADEGRLQLPLYMIAARGFGLEPIGGLYSPLAATKDDRPRGLLSKEHKGTLIPGETGAHFRSDFFEADELDEALDGAVATATAVVAEIRGGRIARNPRNGKCPSWCMLAPVCRVERGIPAPDEEEDEEEML